MTKDFQNGIQCSQFEALLSDALDGVLSEESRRAFDAHHSSCPLCGPMFAEAQQGMLWVQSLAEVEPPRNLVHNILAATSMAAAVKSEGAPAAAAKVGWIARLWKPVSRPLSGVMQPRFVTSFAMAFFSLSLTLGLGGVKLKDLAHMDLRPSSIKKTVVLQYTQIESRVVKYYENMRVVYEIESRVRELRKSAPAEEEGKPQEQPKEEKKNKNDNNDTSGQPEKKQEQYSNLENGLVAGLKTSNEGAS